MPDLPTLGVFLSAAVILAVSPGPGLLYVLTRSLRGGRREGYASTFGTMIGGSFHIVVAAFGLSAILATSALAFSVVKYVGAAYLVFLGIQTILQNRTFEEGVNTTNCSQDAALRQGIVTELLNPKTALFFLAFIPQFINPEGSVVLQFLLLGGIVVLLNGVVDIIIASLAGPLGQLLSENVRLRQGQRLFTGGALIALGTYLAVADNK